MTAEFEKDSQSNEKKIKSKERQVQELKKELQRIMDKEKEAPPPPSEPVPAPVTVVVDDAKSADDDLVDTSYLKHIVLRYVFGLISYDYKLGEKVKCSRQIRDSLLI